MDVPPRYLDLRELGRGDFGVVYSADDVERGERVALKCAPHSPGSPGSPGSDGTSTPRRAPPLHPNVVRIHDVSIVGEHRWTSMELIDGMDVMSWIRPPKPVMTRDPRPLAHPLLLGQPTQDAGVSVFTAASADEVRRLRDVLPQLAAGLAALHRAELLHRDLRPANVLVEKSSGRVVLVDFDLEDAFAGSPAYMAPEQSQAEGLGPKVDWYALGVLLFEALTGALPFFGNAQEVVLRKQTGSAPAPSFCVDLSNVDADDLDILCTRLLRREPTLRAGEAEVMAVAAHGLATKIA